MSDFGLLIVWGLATLSVAGVSVIIGRRFGLDYVVATMAGMLVVSNILAVKLVVVWHYTVPAGVLPFAATFLLTDLIAEKWGRAQAQRTIWTAFYTSLIVLVPITIAVHWKEAFPSDLFDSFDDVLGLAPRIVLASFTAYLISQHHDVIAFHFWRRLTQGKYLWLRNNASTVVSQFIDTVIFITIAFAGRSDVPPLMSLIVGQYVVKIIIAALDTPLMYLISYVMDRIPDKASAETRG